VDRGLDIDVIDHPDAERPARPSSTIVLLRDGDDELEVLMIHRGDGTAFSGVWAFPGGVIEPGDVPPGTAPDPLPAARVAAARETREEVGLDVAVESLVFWSHWLPPATSPARFSTWFFVAPAGDGHRDEHVTLAEDEVRSHRWVVPAVALAAQERGEALLLPPTYVTLHQLVRYGDVASALAAAAPEHYATQITTDRDGVRYCLWHGDAGYGPGDLAAPGSRHRLAMDDERGWNYLRAV
jgi:8-oxo-dGTP pyrophosphatase MutT (NUDIX family)